MIKPADGTEEIADENSKATTIESGPKCDGCAQPYEKGDFPVVVTFDDTGARTLLTSNDAGITALTGKGLCRKCREPFVAKTKEDTAKLPIDGPSGNGIASIGLLAARGVLDGRGLVDDHPSEMLRALARRVDSDALREIMPDYESARGLMGEAFTKWEAEWKARACEYSDRLRTIAFDDRLSTNGCDVSPRAEIERARIAARWSCAVAATGLDRVASLIEERFPKQAKALRECETEFRNETDFLGDDSVRYRKAVVAVGLAIEPIVCVSAILGTASQAMQNVQDDAQDFACPEVVALCLEHERKASKAARAARACLAVYSTVSGAHRACLAACACDVELTSKVVFDDVYASLGSSWRMSEHKKWLRESLLELFERFLAVGFSRKS